MPRTSKASHRVKRTATKAAKPRKHAHETRATARASRLAAQAVTSVRRAGG